MPYVYSTATCSGIYAEYKTDSEKNSGHAQIARKVLINGGHGVINKQFITPKGVMTKVTEDELEFLLKNKKFQQHVKAGFITHDKSRIDPSKRAKDMAKGDNSFPLTPDDFKEGANSSNDARIYTGQPPR